MPKLIICTAAAILAAAAPARGGEEFAAQRVTLLDHIDLPAFDATHGSACWGYVSPSGREYALVGLFNQLAVVEITDPSNAQIIGQIPHSGSTWCEVKTYGAYCYATNETGGGVDVIDLSNVDNGVVILVQRLTDLGLQTSHTVTVDTDSGFLYLNGSNLGNGRLCAWDLANPADPVFAGQVSGSQGVYCHDSQVVTYTSGPYAGKQIAFSANGGTGLDIYDVTDKSNMFRLSRTTYPHLAYAHQAWLSEDRQHLYLNDELDNVNETVIFDVTNLSGPVVVGSSTSGVQAYDHNLFYHDGFIYEAEYHAGLRVFCASDPVHPVQVGWFDTYPANDGGNFDGAWHVYPFFPSGTVIISDMDRGLFVVDPSEALAAGAVIMAYPQGQPYLLDSAGGTPLVFQAQGACGASPAAGTALLRYDDGGGYVSVTAVGLGGDDYEAVFGPTACGSSVSYYVSIETTGGAVFTDPAGAPAATYAVESAHGVSIVSEDTFETDLGWVSDPASATAGAFERGVPINDPVYPWDPETDGDGSGQCWLTGNYAGDSDVDNGLVRLISPLLDLTAEDLGITWEYFLRLNVANGFDGMRVEINNNGGTGAWTQLAKYLEDGGPAWHHDEVSHSELVALGITLTSTMKVRFTALDGNPQSVVEAAVDDFKITQLDCTQTAGDLNGDGSVGVADLLVMLGAWGPCGAPCPPSCPADVDGDCQVAVTDLLVVLANWTL